MSEEPGDAQAWEEERERLYPAETNETYRDYANGKRLPYEGPWVPTEQLRAEAVTLLASERLTVTEAAHGRLLNDMADLYVSLCDLMIRRAQGDFGADAITPTLPEWTPLNGDEVRPADGVGIMSLFEAYVAERKPAAATTKQWRPIIEKLVAFLGHADASRVSPEDIIRWKDALLASGIAAKSIREKYLAAAKVVFGCGKVNRRITQNPVSEVPVLGGKAKRLRDPGFTDEEAKAILSYVAAD